MACVEVGEVQLWWEERGAGGVPLVLVHGFTGSSDDWADVVPSLAADRRVVTVDLRGHGRSDNTGDEAGYTLEALTADLTGFLHAVGIDRCDLLGHSLGGMVVLRHALRHPDTVRSLVLMDTSPEGIDGVEGFLSAQAELVSREGIEALVTAADRSPLEGEDATIAALQGEDRHRARGRARRRAMDPAALVGLTPHLYEQEGVTHRLGEIDCPTTVVVGADDRPLVAPSRLLAREIPGATLEEIPGAAHNPQKSAPERWMEVVRGHLRSADRLA